AGYVHRRMVDQIPGRRCRDPRFDAGGRYRRPGKKTPQAPQAQIRRCSGPGRGLTRVAAQTHTACVALGANLGEPLRQIEAGFTALAALPGTRLLARSSLYRSAPVGYADQPD